MKYPPVRVLRAGYFCEKTENSPSGTLADNGRYCCPCGRVASCAEFIADESAGCFLFFNLKQIGIAAAGYTQNFEDY